MNTRDKLAQLRRSEAVNQEHERRFREGREKKMTTEQFRAVRKLIRQECCNYDPDGYCLLLDRLCPQLQQENHCCNWFFEAVLPLNKELHAVLTGGNRKACAVCGKLFVPTGNRAQYCEVCAANVRRQKDAERKYATRHAENTVNVRI